MRHALACIHLPVCMPVLACCTCMYPLIHPPAHLPGHPPLYSPVCPSARPPTGPPAHSPTRLSTRLPVRPSARSSVQQPYRITTLAFPLMQPYHIFTCLLAWLCTCPHTCSDRKAMRVFCQMNTTALRLTVPGASVCRYARGQTRAHDQPSARWSPARTFAHPPACIHARLHACTHSHIYHAYMRSCTHICTQTLMRCLRAVAGAASCAQKYH